MKSSLFVHKAPLKLQEHPVYKKAIKLYTLSRKLTRQLSSDTAILHMYTSSCEDYRTLDQLTMFSLSLAPKIALAQTARNYTDSLNHIESLEQNIQSLRSICDQLVTRITHKRKAVIRIQKELNALSVLQRNWQLSITQAN